MRTADTAIAAVLKRDRVVIAVALTSLVLLAWAYFLWLSANMAMPLPVAGLSGVAAPADEMAGMDMAASSGDGMSEPAASGAGGAIEPSFRAWVLADFAFIFAMWSVMMVGMMTPSVAPMVLLYAGVGRKAQEIGTPFASTVWFLGGYLAVWVGFSALATLAQWALTSLALLTPMMASASAVFGGIVLIAAGLYQWTPLKGACLQACQAPLSFLQAHGGFQAEPIGALTLGIAHGAYCLGCCVALMALLFVGGIMNLLWIAGLMVLILLEKMLPNGQIVSRISGALFGAAGLWLLIRAM